MTTAELFEEVVRAVPAFSPVRSDHIEYFDELLPHLLMADLFRFVELAFGGADLSVAAAPTQNDVKAILAVLEHGLVEGDAATENAIAVSFLEDIDCTQFAPEIEPLLGPRMRVELQRQRNWEGTV